MKTSLRRNRVAVLGLSAICGFGLLAAETADWPSDYEEKLAAHIAATTPSGTQVGQSSPLAVESEGTGVGLSAVASVDAPGVSSWWTLSGVPIDTSPVGLMLLFR